MNVQTELNYAIYEGNKTRIGYRVITVISELETGGKIGDYSAQYETPVTALENALDDLAANSVRGDYEPLNITVKLPSEITVATEAQDVIKAKYQADPVIESVSFE